MIVKIKQIVKIKPMDIKTESRKLVESNEYLMKLPEIERELIILEICLLANEYCKERINDLFKQPNTL